MNRQLRKRVATLLAAMAVLPGAASLALTGAGEKSTPSAASARAADADRLTPSELEELLGGIALYPDPLLANVLAASVYPDDVAEAAAFVTGGGKSEQIDANSWEDPVKAVAKIPEVIKLMGQYKEWTIALGQAYLIQAKDVMDVVQTLRKKAKETGALKTSPQQKVVVEQEVVYIKPADPEIIYVPSYSPSVVYVQQQPVYNNDAAVAGVVGFGLGVATGLILANNLDCDWHGGYVGYGWRGGGYHHHHGGDYNGGNYKSNNDITINGDVNIGNRNTNVSGNKVGNTANVGNRVGNEGNAFAPNKSKSLATSSPNQLSQFKGGSTSANRVQVPGGRTGAANTGVKSSNTGSRSAARPSAQPTGRSEAGARSTARPSAQPTGRSDAPSGTLKSMNSARQTPSSPSRVPNSPSRQSSQSAYSGGGGTRAESQRGASSRSNASSRSTSSGMSRSSGSRSSGGGGSRGGGGRGGGGRR